ncbi:L-serine ammonia-lyase, iron-sulfur-dependent, subunit alpha [Mariniblastus fucicola]|uniref:L-serine ammonia-lyase n=1 Tax=Mariniblastus fucicola TaxID=980251 RepID=A0A5B9PCG3_9BACT|nr:L-serine ammonia-lyase, iron-sulfur-dependent, subunit alpha [Mariniblastus fucicola]QEG24427.1 L-serine dehydratase, alpha chain [Mariniblastus fucicola]
MIVSIFNDVIGPVMRGPSSSHCAAALRIGRLARDLMGGQFSHVKVEFDNSGSLPATHTSQGSDMGLFGGLLGWNADDERLPGSDQTIKESGIELDFIYGDYGDEHPNTYRLTLSNSAIEHSIIAISTGGGIFEVLSIDGVPITLFGDYFETLVWIENDSQIDTESLESGLGADFVKLNQSESTTILQIQSQQPLTKDQLQSIAGITHVAHLDPVLPVGSRRGLTVPFQTCAEMLDRCESGKSLWQLAVEYEMDRGGLTEGQVIEKMCEIVSILRTSIQQGLAGTEYADRVLGFQSGGFAEAMEAGKLIDGGVLNKIVLYTTALMEVKSSMGVIVAAPTAGACAALPATCLAVGESLNLTDEQIAKGMLAAGIIGVFIATHWSFAAEVGGCQAEGGSAASMAAAALVTFQNGTPKQATGAASMAMQNMLGLICDPVANRVEVPCLGKNVMAASNAVSCANMALSGFDAVIPFDETIAAAKRVAERMPREHRCTALGGLAITPTSKAIEKRLAGGCGSGCGCAPVGLSK